MKIAIAQLDYIIGDFEGNLSKILHQIEKAKSENVDILCFGEMATCGYPPRDFLEFEDFIQACNQSIESIKTASKNIAVVIGSPTKNPKIEGKDLYNSVFFIANQEVLYIQHKTLLPTYDIFDEYRYFEPASEFNIVEYKGKKIALTVCEDIWNVGNSNPLYTICPLDEMMKFKPDFTINVSASPFSYDHAADRIHTVRTNVERYKIPMFYINQIGGHTDVMFDGGSLVVNQNGIVADEMPYFKECFQIYDLEDVIQCKTNKEQEKNKIALIHDALLMGIRDYFSKLGFKKAILGLSGGIDSALTAVLAERALGAKNVRGLLMPSQYSSSHSVTDARALAENLGIQYDILAIEPIFKQFEQTLAPQFTATSPNITEENIQARIRGMLLMAMSNKFGYILLNTTNKSEMAVGYGTLYGDMCGGISVLGDVYKTTVYELAKYVNKDKEIIPLSSIQKPPSAELRPNQKDSDSLPEYDILDQILYQYIELRLSPQDIIEKGFDANTVKRACKLVNINEFKREQTAPVLRVSSKAFGMGRRMPIVGKYLS